MNKNNSMMQTSSYKPTNMVSLCKRVVFLSLPSFLCLTLVYSSLFADVGDWRRYYDDGVSEYNNKNYKKAEKILKQAVDMADDEFPKSEYHAKSLYHYGLALYYSGKKNKGIRYIEKAHKYTVKKLGKRHKDSLGILEMLANLRLQSNQPQYAEGIFRRILKYRIKELGEDDKLVFITRERLAKTLSRLDKNEEATNLYEAVIKAHDENELGDAERAAHYEEYARLLRKLGETRKATKASEKAMELRANTRAQAAVNAPSDQTFELVTSTSEFKEPQGFLDFKQNMIAKGYNFSEEYMHSLCKNKAMFTSLQHCIVYWFKSTRRSPRGIYPVATMRIYQYSDAANASSALENLRKSASTSSGLSNNWDYVVNQDHTLYWLNASCTFTKASWQKFLTEFNANIAIDEQGQKSKINCQCRSGCK